MNLHRFEIFFALLAVAATACAQSVLQIELVDGSHVECASALRHMPRAEQFLDAQGKVHLLAAAAIKPASLAALRALPVPKTRAVSTPVPAQAQPSVTIKLKAVASKSSTSYSYQTSWGSNIRTTTAATTYEAALMLWGAPSATVTVIAVIGDQVQTREVELQKLAEWTMRLAEPDRQTTVTDLKYLDWFTVERAEKTEPFVQVVMDGRVIGEGGFLPGHKAGELLVVDSSRESSRSQ